MPKGDAGILKYGADTNGKLLVAAPATPQEPPIAFARLGILHLVHISIAAPGACGGISPTLCLQELNRRSLVSTGKWYVGHDLRLVGRYFGLLSFDSHDIIILESNTISRQLGGYLA